MWLEPRQPFDLQRTLRLVLSPPALLNGRKFPTLLDNFDHGEYRRVVEVHGEPVLYGVSDEKRDSKPGLRVRILKGPGNPTIAGITGACSQGALESQELPCDIGPGVWDIHSPRVPSTEELIQAFGLTEEQERIVRLL